CLTPAGQRCRPSPSRALRRFSKPTSTCRSAFSPVSATPPLADASSSWAVYVAVSKCGFWRPARHKPDVLSASTSGLRRAARQLDRAASELLVFLLLLTRQQLFHVRNPHRRDCHHVSARDQVRSPHQGERD